MGDSFGALLVIMHQRHQVRVKPWMALVAIFILVKLMGAFVPPPQVKELKVMSSCFLTFVLKSLPLRQSQFEVLCFRLADGDVI